MPSQPTDMSPETSASTPEALGAAARARRRALGLDLREAAARAGVGPRFLSEFERGKATAELGKALAVLRSLGLSVRASPDGDAGVPGGYSRLLATEFPYDWSNRHMDSSTFIRQVLAAGRFEDVLRVAGHFGFDRTGRELAGLEDATARARAAGMLSRVYLGMLQARRAVADEPEGAPHAHAS